MAPSAAISVGLFIVGVVRGLQIHDPPAFPVPVPQQLQKVKNIAVDEYRSSECARRVWQNPLAQHRPDCLPLPENKVKGPTSIPTYFISCDQASADTWSENYASLFKNLHRVSCVLGADNAAVEGHAVQNLTELIKGRGGVDDYLGDHYEVLKTPTPGVIGCILSHLVSIKTAHESGDEVALILETDAMPLSPWWTQSIEEFVESLPSDWESAQLSWQTPPKGHIHKQTQESYETLKYRRTKQRFINGSSWGTAAYLIHRRGIRKVMSRLLNSTSGKFDLAHMRRKCPSLTADDCLMNFTPLRGTPLGDMLNYKPINTRSYMAVPPMFTYSNHLSFTVPTGKEHHKPRGVKSLCDDMNSAASYSGKTCTNSRVAR